MGCDYYLITRLDVLYTNDKKEEDLIEIEISRDRMYSWASESDTYTSSEMYAKEKESHESLICVYENHTWLIKNASRIQDYRDLLSENKVNLDQVKSIHRRTFFQNR